MPHSPKEAVDPRLASLTYFVDHTDQLAEHTMNSVEWEAVEVLMPRILRGKSKEDIKQLLLAEIDGMSKKRLMAVLAGETLEESSSSEEEEEDMNEAQESAEPSEETVKEKEDETPKDEEAKEKSPEPEPIQVDNGEEAEEGEIGEDGEEITNRSVTPPDPSPPKVEAVKLEQKESQKAEELDTDEEIDRQLEKDLEDFI